MRINYCAPQNSNPQSHPFPGFSTSEFWLAARQCRREIGAGRVAVLVIVIMFTEASVRQQMEVLVRGDSHEGIAFANTYLMSFQSSGECWPIARQLLMDRDANVQILASQLFYTKTKSEWTSLAQSHQIELRNYLAEQLRLRQLPPPALKKMAQALAFVCVAQSVSLWPSAFSDVLTFFSKDLSMEVLSSITSVLRDSSDTSTNDVVSALFLSQQEKILSFLEECVKEVSISTVADLLMELSSTGFEVLKHSISVLLVQGMLVLSAPAIDVLIVAIAKSLGAAEIHKLVLGAGEAAKGDLLSCYEPRELQSLHEVGAALACLSKGFATFSDDIRKKLCDLVCSFCSDHLFLLVQVVPSQNEPYAAGLWEMLVSATSDPEVEVASLAINYWSDIKGEVLKGFQTRTEFTRILPAAEKCAHIITMKCCFPSMDYCHSTDPEAGPVQKLRKSSEDSLYSLLCIFSEVDKAQSFLETFLPLLDSQNPLHLELFLFVMRSMGLELESDKNRSYIGNLLTHFMKNQHPVVTRATLLFISEVSSTIKKIPGLLDQTLEFANEQIVAEAASGCNGVTPVAVECLFNLMFYSDHQLQDQGLSLLRTAVMVLGRDYVGEVDRVLDLIWLLLNTVPREVALKVASEVISAALTGMEEIQVMPQGTLHNLLKRCYHLIRILTTESWIKAIVHSALSHFCQVVIAAVKVGTPGTLSQVGDLAYIMSASQSRSVMSALRAGMETATKSVDSVRFVSGNCGLWYQAALSFGAGVAAEGSWHEWLTHFYGTVHLMLAMEITFVLENLEGLLRLIAATLLQPLDQNLSKMALALCKALVDGPHSELVVPFVPLLVASTIRSVARIHMTSLVALLHLLLKYRVVAFAGFQQGMTAGLMDVEFRLLTSEEKETVARTFGEVTESQLFILKEMLFELRNRAEGVAFGKSLSGIAKKIGSSTPKSRKELVLIEC